MIIYSSLFKTEKEVTESEIKEIFKNFLMQSTGVKESQKIKTFVKNHIKGDSEQKKFVERILQS